MKISGTEILFGYEHILKAGFPCVPGYPGETQFCHRKYLTQCACCLECILFYLDMKEKGEEIKDYCFQFLCFKKRNILEHTM